MDYTSDRVFDGTRPLSNEQVVRLRNNYKKTIHKPYGFTTEANIMVHAKMAALLESGTNEEVGEFYRDMEVLQRFAEKFKVFLHISTADTNGERS